MEMTSEIILGVQDNSQQHNKSLQSHQSQECDELSFPQNTIIKNVKKVDEHWWRGDYEGRLQYLFMVNLTQEIDSEKANDFWKKM